MRNMRRGMIIITLLLFLVPALFAGPRELMDVIKARSTDGIIKEVQSGTGFMAYDGISVLAKEVPAYPDEDSYIEVVDLDNDGIDEILAVGSSSDMRHVKVSVYAVREHTLYDLIWGVDFGIAYFHYDIDGDGVEEIIGLDLEGPTERVGFAGLIYRL
jgi:hypothetical protein